VLAIELTWPESMDPESWRYDPWTVSAHWDQGLEEKVQGFGGSVVQRSPSLILVAFGLPQTLEQLPQRACADASASMRTGGSGPQNLSLLRLRCCVVQSVWL
jgi:hypothetical protein